MKGAVKDNAKQFLLNGTPKFPCIVPDPVDTDVYFPANRLTRIRQRKGDDIRVKIVLKKLAVNLQQVLVRTENIAQSRQRFLFLSEEFDNELLQTRSFGQGNGLKNMKLYFGVSRWHFRKS